MGNNLITKVPSKMWNDKRIKFETKIIYGYILSKGFDRKFTDLNVGELQQTIPIKRKGLIKNLEKLERYKYLIFDEYDTGMFTISLT